MRLRTAGVQLFLQVQRAAHNNPSILDHCGPEMECQVNVARGNGEPVDGKPTCFSDGLNTWYSFRIADQSSANKKLTYPLELHAREIGFSGWNWAEKRSKWVGFDFDDLVGHAKGVGIDDNELARIRQSVEAVPWIEARRSTRGAGLHLVAYFAGDGIPTDDHNEHAALGRCVLGMLSTVIGFDLTSNVDACGRILWVWSHRATTDNQGFCELKPVTASLCESDLPGYWRDYLDVVARKRSRVRIRGISPQEEDSFDLLASSCRRVPLSDKHRVLIKELAQSGFSTVWVPDHHLLQTHTGALQALIDDPAKKESLGLVGFFKTNSMGHDPGTPNCFAFPADNGAWKVYRFNSGVSEHDMWEQDGEGWTCCYFNRAPSLAIASKALGGIERPNNGGFLFGTAIDALRVAESLGQAIELPEHLYGRETILKRNADGRLVVEIERRESDEGMRGWDATTKKNKWVRVFSARTDLQKEETAEQDGVIRVLITPAGEFAGYMVKSSTGSWDRQPAANCKMRLQALGFTRTEAECLLGSAVAKRWELVNLPFQPEFPGERRWNLDAPQFRFRPVQLAPDEQPFHPTWDLILDHIGSDLNEAIREMEWCQRHDIRTGSQWLLNLIACILRDPFEPTPYLFLWGPEDSGKSIFHEAVGLLMTKGVVSADRALTNSNNFNGELANAILAVIEEVDLSHSPSARNRLKEWVTGRRLSIRRMRTDTYDQPNTLHFVQCANRADFCPVFPKDSRIVVCHVPMPQKTIPKSTLLKQLEAEAPHFMATLFQIRLPEPNGRLRIPVIETADKLELGGQNAPVTLFLKEMCLLDKDARIAKRDVYRAYQAFCDDHDLRCLCPTEFGKELKEFTGGQVRSRGKVEDANGKRCDAYEGIQLIVQVRAA